MINELSKQINDNAKAKGFWDEPRNTGEMLMLIVSEISEALEADRKPRNANLAAYEQKVNLKHDGEFCPMCFLEEIKDTFADELADAMIRIMDLAYSKHIDLEKHISLKMKYNSLREYKHGKKY